MSFPEPFYRWRPHPWHGLSVGPEPPEVLHAYIEITPFDSVKYEIDKGTGYLRVDRPQPYSSQPPALYGFVPRTYCGDRIAALCPSAAKGDADPLDICVLSERPINRSEVVVPARVVGGLQTVDRGEADDKIIAVLENDRIWGDARDIGDVPEILASRLRHYFSTYKQAPGGEPHVRVQELYGRRHALEVVEAARADYADEYGE